MKKLALIFTLALPLVMWACGDDNEEPEVTLDQTTASIEYGKTLTLTASEKNCVWASSNEFVASVNDKGEVTALHAGEAEITATKGDGSAKCKIVVTTTNDNFTMPILDWGASIDDIKGKVSGLELALEDSVTLGYSTNGTFPMYIYGFESNKLAASTLTVSSKMDEDDDLMGFLEQRYQELPDEEGDDYFFFVDAMNLTNANVCVVYSLNIDEETGAESVIATWAPVEHTKAAFGHAKAMHKAHIEAAKKMNK